MSAPHNGPEVPSFLEIIYSANTLEVEADRLEKSDVYRGHSPELERAGQEKIEGLRNVAKYLRSLVT